MPIFRINQYLAKCGLGSRRSVETLIQAGQVKVNGKKVEDFSLKVDSTKDKVTLDGEPVKINSEYLYFRYYKPAGVTSTMHDAHAEKTLRTELPELPPGVQYAGRLDRDSEGLILLTNDGNLIQKLTHPSLKTPKKYWVELNRKLDSKELIQFRSGIKLEEGKTSAAKIQPLPQGKGDFWYEIELTQGWKRQIRRMIAELGAEVTKLIRIQMGPINLEHLQKGQIKPLTEKEITKVRQTVKKNSNV